MNCERRWRPAWTVGPSHDPKLNDHSRHTEQPMDPITAFANVATALLTFLTEVVKGQTPAQKEKLWTFYLEDLERWRKLFKLDKVDKP